MQIGNFTTQSAADLKPLSEFRGIFCGRKGTGKSNAAISFIDSDETKKKSALVIDLDHRKQSLRGRERVEIISFKKSDGFEQLQNFLYECSKEVDKGTFQEKFCMTLFSSITSLQTFLTRDSLRYIGTKGDGDGGRGAQKIGAMEIPGLRNYLYVSEGVEKVFLDQLFYLPGHLIIEGHIVNHYNSKNEIDGETILGTDKIAEKIPTFFDEVWRFYKKEPPSPILPPEYMVGFKSNLADTTYKQLPTEINITNKRFYPELKKLLENIA